MMKSKKPIPPLVQHQDHHVEVHASTAHNYAKYYCRDCNKFVAWLSKHEALKAQELGLIRS
jgi:hypothetical protein